MTKDELAMILEGAGLYDPNPVATDALPYINAAIEHAVEAAINQGRREGFVEYAKEFWRPTAPVWLSADVVNDLDYDGLINESEAEANRRWPVEG